MKKRYPALRVISVVYKVFGVLTALLTLIVSGSMIVSALSPSSDPSGAGASPLGALFPTGGFVGVLAGCIMFVYGAFWALTIYGLGEGIQVFLDMEDNTRSTALALERPTPPNLHREVTMETGPATS